jgi:hypothetical protein
MATATDRTKESIMIKNLESGEFINLGDGYYIRLQFDGHLMSWSIYHKPIEAPPEKQVKWEKWQKFSPEDKQKAFWEVRYGLSERSARDLVEQLKASE